MDLLRFQDAIVAELRTRFGDKVPVEAHERDDFTPADINAALSKNNYVALRVMYLGVATDPPSGTTSTAGVNMPNAWAIFVCAKDGARDGVSRHRRILSMLPHIFAAVVANEWEAPDEETLSKPAGIRVRPYYGGDSDKTASVAAWGVTWRLSTSFEDDEADQSADLRPLKFLLTHWDLAPKDGVIDATDDVRFPNPGAP